MGKKQDGQRPEKRQRTRGSTAELEGLRSWLSALELGAVRPTVHVNGHHHPTALVVVDLGSPLKQVRLNSEQSGELGQRLRRVAKEVLGREANIRVSADNSNGIHWAWVSA